MSLDLNQFLDTANVSNSKINKTFELPGGRQILVESENSSVKKNESNLIQNNTSSVTHGGGLTIGGPINESFS
ncbi:MAG TPA: hypothetical protein DEP20_00220 [Fusobacteria bacterium]|nr:hypothetical protein [Fusobacteriota bacterium]|tara:strand:+ start:4451 stop:4669 length:219 start_codon:yes stop_codon:yes gene_type:complete